MLIRFCIRNFLSYNEPVVFSMAAGPYKRLLGHVAEVGKHQILKGGFIFGANAGGKSNFVRAMSFVRSVIIRGLERTSCDRCYFRLSKGEIDPIGEFRIDLTVSSKIYSYILRVHYPQALIVGERLIVQDGGSSKCIFDVAKSEQGHYVISGDYNTTLEGEDRMRFDIYREDALHVKARRETFLSDIASRAGRKRKSEFFSHIYTVYHWFKRLVIIFPNTRYGDNARYVYDGSYRENLGGLLRAFDTGVESLDAANADIEKIFGSIPEEQRSEIKASLIRGLTVDGVERAQCSIDGRGYIVTYENGTLSFKEVVANHGKADDPFERDDESDGTQRLFDLLPLKNVFETERVVVIDEFDRSLHTKATLRFVQMFYEAAAGKKSQLIVTTHDHNVMDLDVLRQDEIWFVDRGADHSSNIYPLTKFKARFDKDVRKDYLLGRYGALPVFKALDILDDKEDA